MTEKQRFVKALKREPMDGLVPHFELVFYLTMEALGKVHPSHRWFHQWKQMSASERKLQINDIADTYNGTARKYGHSAIIVQAAADDQESTRPVLEAIRERSGDEYFILLHGDPTCAIPDGGSLEEFVVQLYEEPEKIHEASKSRLDEMSEWAMRYSGAGLLDGFALCSDYAFNVNPFFNPTQFDEFVVPYLKEIILRYHKMGFYVIKHTDGNIAPILGQIVDCGPDALHSIDPQGGMALSKVKREYGNRVCLIGNVNCGLLQTGSEEECVRDIRRALHEGMNGYGYVFSTSNCIYTGMPLSRYERMVRIWREEGVYAAAPKEHATDRQ